MLCNIVTRYAPYFYFIYLDNIWNTKTKKKEKKHRRALYTANVRSECKIDTHL